MFFVSTSLASELSRACSNAVRHSSSELGACCYVGFIGQEVLRRDLMTVESLKKCRSSRLSIKSAVGVVTLELTGSVLVRRSYSDVRATAKLNLIKF